MKRLLFVLIVIDLVCIGSAFFLWKNRGKKNAELPKGVQAIYYVSPAGNDNNPGSIEKPFATIYKARDVVRTINGNMMGDIIINCRSGFYPLDSTFTLTSEDKGTNGYNIIYQAYNCEKAVISGGKKITGWTLKDAMKNIYMANVGTAVDTRQLYVNEMRAIRARSEDASGWSENGDGYDCPSAVASWGNSKNVEIVSYSDWKCHRGPIATVSGSHAVMAQPYWNLLHTQFGAPPAWIENAYELLDAEGEWYLDHSTGTLYYKPGDKEDMSNTEVVIPVLETLVRGSAVSNVQFKRLTFSYATWLHPDSVGGYPCLQADWISTAAGGMQIPGNISFDHCHHLQFNQNTFEHLGINGLQLFKGCKNNLVYNNTFRDISGTAISVGSVQDNNASFSDLVKDNTIDNNSITNAAVEYAGCVGIFVGYTEHTVITHNLIRHLPYSGISMGWGWSNAATIAKNNEIGYNRIDSVMTVLNDGGAIYTLSAQAGTKIHDNYINNQLHEFGSLYPDEGSSNMHWYNNVVQNEVRWLHIWTPSIQFDTVDFNYYDNPTQTLNGSNCIVENNTNVTGGAWPAAAVKIMNNSGLVGESAVGISVKSVCIDPPSLVLTAGSTSQLTSTVIPFDATIKNVSWGSDDNSIVSVNATGMVTANKKGVATITVRTLDGNKTASCLISVVNLASNWWKFFGIASIIISLLIAGISFFKRSD